MTEPLALRIARLRTRDPGFDAALAALLVWDVAEDSAVLDVARDVIRRVRAEGDAALLELTRRFDRLDVQHMGATQLGQADFKAAFQRIGDQERRALETAAERIRRYHEHQLAESWTFTDALGNRLGQRVTPLEKVGVYVPGGQASYPSTVLMTAVPARVAGVGEVIMAVPTPGGARNDLVLAAAHVAGVDRGFTIGGAQAIAALAIGTETVPRVDKIVGPGGVFVAAAKRLVYGEVGIDMVAGPSEVLVVADGTTPVDWIVYDLFSQAEHDAAAQALLLCPDAEYLDRVAEAMRRHLASAPRREIISASLSRRGALIETRDVHEAVRIANRVAPEHLQLCVEDADRWVEEIRNAGAIFVGAHSPEVIGDYTAGPSHVLPTYGSARFSSPLGVYDFQKKSSVIHLSVEGSQALARDSAALAHGEGLSAHARAAELRVSGIDHNES
ncbi:MAG TPA: histidinol dehydrogenase [Pseudomonadales bacterium]